MKRTWYKRKSDVSRLKSSDPLCSLTIISDSQSHASLLCELNSLSPIDYLHRRMVTGKKWRANFGCLLSLLYQNRQFSHMVGWLCGWFQKWGCLFPQNSLTILNGDIDPGGYDVLKVRYWCSDNIIWMQKMAGTFRSLFLWIANIEQMNT